MSRRPVNPSVSIVTVEHVNFEFAIGDVTELLPNMMPIQTEGQAAPRFDLKHSNEPR